MSIGDPPRALTGTASQVMVTCLRETCQSPRALLGTAEGWDSPAELASPGPLGLEASSKKSSP